MWPPALLRSLAAGGEFLRGEHHARKGGVTPGPRRRTGSTEWSSRGRSHFLRPPPRSSRVGGTRGLFFPPPLGPLEHKEGLSPRSAQGERMAKKGTKLATRGYGVTIRRKATIRRYPFQRYFRGFEATLPIRELFGAAAPRILRDLKVEFFSPPFGYMGTSDEDGHLIVSSHHLRTSDFRTLYLDV